MAGEFETSHFDMDVKAFEVALQRELAKLEIKSKTALNALGLDIQNRAREYAPVKTGRLRNSIVSVPGKDEKGDYVDIGTSVKYAAAVEYGTREYDIYPRMKKALKFTNKAGEEVIVRKVTHPAMPAQPFLRPALIRAVIDWPEEFKK